MTLDDLSRDALAGLVPTTVRVVGPVAAELERRHGFTFVHDARLTASVDVSKDEGVTGLAELTDDGDDIADDDDDDASRPSGFRSLVVDLDRNDDLN